MYKTNFENVCPFFGKFVKKPAAYFHLATRNFLWQFLLFASKELATLDSRQSGAAYN
jgi:hypothetical protein